MNAKWVWWLKPHKETFHSSVRSFVRFVIPPLTNCKFYRFKPFDNNGFASHFIQNTQEMSFNQLNRTQINFKCDWIRLLCRNEYTLFSRDQSVEQQWLLQNFVWTIRFEWSLVHSNLVFVVKIIFDMEFSEQFYWLLSIAFA